MTRASEILGQLRAIAERTFGPSVFSPSPRERGLIALFAAVAAVYIAVLAFDFAQNARDRAANAISDLEAQRREQVVNSGDRAALVARHVTRVRAHSFRDETVSIAKVRAQSHFENLLREAGVQEPRVSIDPQTSGEGEIQLVGLTIEGVFDWGTFLPFAAAVAQGEPSVGVEAFSVDAGFAPVFRMRLQAPVMTTEPS